MEGTDTPQQEVFLKTLLPIIRRGPATDNNENDDLLTLPIFDGLVILISKAEGLFVTRDNIVPPLTGDDLAQRAYANLMKQIGDTVEVSTFAPGEGTAQGLGIVSKGNNFESSLILVEDVWENIFNVIEVNDLLFSIPTQETFMVADINNEKCVEFLKETTAKVFSDPNSRRKISPTIYRKERGKLIVIYNV